MTEKIELTKKEINDLHNMLDDNDKEIIEDDDLEKLKKDNNNSGKSKVLLSKVFLDCYDGFSNNLYAFTSDDEKLPNKFVKYLEYFKENAEKLRNLIEEYGDGKEFESHFSGEKIKDIVNDFRDDMQSLIHTFFRIAEGDD